MEKKSIEKQIVRLCEEAVSHEKKLEDQKEYVKKEVFKNKRLIEDLAVLALNELLNNRLYEERGIIRQRLIDACIGREYPNESRRGPEIMATILKDRVNSILDSFPCGAKMLGDCTFDEVLAEAHKYDAQAKGCYEKAAILFTIAKAGKGDEIVRDKVTAQKVSKIINNVCKKKNAG